MKGDVAANATARAVTRAAAEVYFASGGFKESGRSKPISL